MNENEIRQKVVDQAKSWIGRKEADGSHQEIINTYNTIRPLPRGYKLQPSDAWCAGFVSAVAQACGLTDILYPECGCDRMVALYKKAGRWMEDDAYLPQLAEVIFYDWQDPGTGDCTGGADHVGLVLQVDGETITVIEGNMSHEVGLRTLQRNGRYIRGYGRPDYAAAASAINAHEDPEDEPPSEIQPPPMSESDTPATVTLPAPPAGWHYVPLPDLQIGDGGEDSPLEEAVRAAQLLLKGRGFPVGWMGADGDFGRKTESAVGKYQADRQIERDGIIGPETWRKLICE